MSATEQTEPRITLHAVVGDVHHRKRPYRLIFVDDPLTGRVVPVWWTLRARRMWRCSIDGRMDTPLCEHVLAAALELGSELLGVRLLPRQQTGEARRMPDRLRRLACHLRGHDDAVVGVVLSAAIALLRCDRCDRPKMAHFRVSLPTSTEPAALHLVAMVDKGALDLLQWSAELGAHLAGLLDRDQS